MLSENLKKIRNELGLSMAKFSEKLEIPAMTLIHYERGERAPSAQLFIQLDKKLDVNLNWFVTGNGNMFNNVSIPCGDIEPVILQAMYTILKNNGIIK